VWFQITFGDLKFQSMVFYFAFFFVFMQVLWLLFYALGLDSCVVACDLQFESFACGVPFRVFPHYVLYV